MVGRRNRRRLDATDLALSASAGEQEASKALILMGLSVPGVHNAFSTLEGMAGAGVFLKNFCKIHHLIGGCMSRIYPR